MTLGEYVGQRARRLRVGRGLRVRDVAERARMYRSNVSRFEAGSYPPNLETIQRMSEALGCTVADLVAGWESAHDAR